MRRAETVLRVPIDTRNGFWEKPGMSDPLSPEELRDIQASIFAGRKIQAIKWYRKYSRVGLKEAKDAVDELEKKLRAESPEKFGLEEEGKTEATESRAPGVQVSKGCFGMLTALLMLAGTLVLLVFAALRR
jgi:ribosomal L7/L12-like protein